MNPADHDRPVPPIAAPRPHQVPSPHGTRLDEYYWLRDDSRADAAVLAHLHAENAYKQAMTAHTRGLEDRVYDEIIARIKQDDASVPYRKRGYWYYTRYVAGGEYPVYARRPGSMEAGEQVMLDGNLLATGAEFFQVGGLAVAPDDRMLAYTEDRVGRRQFTLVFKDLASGETLPERIGNVEAEVVWAADSRTVLYVEKHPDTLLGYRVRCHRLGTDPASDPLLFEQTDESLFTSVDETKDERYLLIESAGHDATELRYARADDPALDFRLFLPKEDGHEYYPDHLDGRWIVRSNWQAPNFRIVEVAVGQEADRGAWRDIVAHREDAAIEGVSLFRGFMAIGERSGGLRKLRIRPWAGGGDFFVGANEAACTTFLGVNPELDTSVVRYVYTSLTTPLSTYDYDTATGKATLLKREPVLGDFDPADYATEHAWARARDGALVPVSIVHRRDVAHDATSPLLVYGYGAYGHCIDPTFSLARLSLLDRGFVFAIAHVRGGAEMGRRWYDAGKLLHKQNSFNDFIDVTRYLVGAGYADPARVFAMGGSAGGLLMGAVVNMAPALYRGVVTQVPFVDIVTTMLDEGLPLTTNEYVEWGDPRERHYYDCMLVYSPYDNVKRQDYPAMLVTTGLWDSQVQYWEPAKWVARLRARKTDDRPLLLRTTMEAGHGGKSGRFERFREIAEEYAFILDQAGIGA